MDFGCSLLLFLLYSSSAANKDGNLQTVYVAGNTWRERINEESVQCTEVDSALDNRCRYTHLKAKRVHFDDHLYGEQNDEKQLCDL